MVFPQHDYRINLSIYMLPCCRVVERAILNSSKSPDIVFDPFGGSGTTLIAAERTGRRARLIELDPKYADVAVQRWQEQTGQSARLGPSGTELEMASN